MAPLSTGYSSQRYGNCEMCGEHASDVWIGKRDDGWHVFGHEQCVRAEIMSLPSEWRCVRDDHGATPHARAKGASEHLVTSTKEP